MVWIEHFGWFLLTVALVGVGVVVHEVAHWFVGARCGLEATTIKIGVGPAVRVGHGALQVVLSPIATGGRVRWSTELWWPSPRPGRRFWTAASRRDRIMALAAGPAAQALVGAVVVMWADLSIAEPGIGDRSIWLMIRLGGLANVVMGVGSLVPHTDWDGEGILLALLGRRPGDRPAWLRRLQPAVTVPAILVLMGAIFSAGMP